MNKTIKCILVVCGAFLSITCTRHDEELYSIATQGTELTITAVREGYNPTTKSIRETDGSVVWCPMDQISVFYNNGTGGGNKFTSQNKEKAPIAEFRGRFEGISAGGESFTDGKYLYGIYPYSKATTYNNGVATIDLPAQQIAEEGTFANGLFPTIARAQGVNLAFYNICGGIKFTVSRNDITSVTIKGNNNERLAGTAKISFDENEKPFVLDDVVDSKKEITVFAPAGGTFKTGKDYYIITYPGKLTNGYTLTFHTSDMKEGIYSSNNTVEIQRSMFGVISQVDKNVTTWSDISSNSGGTNTGIYLGIVGFNDDIYSYPISYLNKESKEEMDTFINELSAKKGTVLYYSVEQAINKLQSVTLPSDLSTAAIVTFTDGLDQGSFMYNDIYSDNNAYLNAINNRIKNGKVNQQPITAFSIGIRGSDVTDVTMFQNNLKKLASSADKSTEVTSMAEVNAKFKEIAEQLSQSNYIQTINLTMPGVPNGTIVRFTFDNINSANKSTLYIEGKFNLTDKSLENVKYVGLTSTSGSTIKGIVNGIFVSFSFEGVHTDNNILISNKFTDEWTYITSNNTWQINSEFDKTENSEIVTKRSSAVIMLVLDCSSSLAQDFVTAQKNAMDFVDLLYEAVEKQNSNNTGDDERVLYSTTPIDLSLAIWQDSVRYYLTKEQYNKANLSNAVIEGLTIVSGGESFILSLKNVQSGSISEVSTAKQLYGSILPTTNQGVIISAKMADINTALKQFGGTTINDSYYTSSTTKNSNGYYTNVIYTSGGVLSTNSSFPYIRGVKSTNSNNVIFWTNPNDLKLSVMINGSRKFLNIQEYNEYKETIETIEGVAVFAGGESFAIHLTNAQSGSISEVSTAKNLYGNILPTLNQGIIISAKMADINTALKQFGGTTINDSYYTSSTTKNSNGYYTNVIYTSGGVLSTNSSFPYIRGVTKLE